MKQWETKTLNKTPGIQQEEEKKEAEQREEGQRMQGGWGVGGSNMAARQPVDKN